jgi:hypothetical protein
VHLTGIYIANPKTTIPQSNKMPNATTAFATEGSFLVFISQSQERGNYTAMRLVPMKLRLFRLLGLGAALLRLLTAILLQLQTSNLFKFKKPLPLPLPNS